MSSEAIYGGSKSSIRSEKKGNTALTINIGVNMPARCRCGGSRKQTSYAIRA